MIRLAITIIIPYLLLTRLGDVTDLGPRAVLLVALAFPIAYMAISLARGGDVGIAPVIGLVSVLLTAGVGALANDPQWLAVKEASVPAIFGLAILATGRTSRPLVGLLVERIVDVDAVTAALAERGGSEAWRRLMARATVIWASVLLIAAALNYALARLVVTSPAGTPAFNDELATMTALGLPVITLPMMVMMSATVWYIVHGVTGITGLAPRQIARGPRLFARVDALARFLRLAPSRPRH